MRRSLRRCVFITIAWVIALIAIRIAWGIYANHSLQQEIDAARARGEPVSLDDLNAAEGVFPLGAPHQARAATRLRYAAANVASRSEEQSRFIAHADLSRDQTTRGWQVMESIARDNSTAFALAAQVASAPSDGWGTPLRDPRATRVRADFDAIVSLADRIALKVLLSHHADDDDGAIDLLCNLLRIGNIVDRAYPFMGGHDAAASIVCDVTDSVERIVTDLRIGSPPAAPREKVLALVAALADESVFQRNGVRQFFGERLLITNASFDPDFWTNAGNSPGDFFEKWSARPAVVLDAARLAGRYSAMARAMCQPNEQAAIMLLPANQPPSKSLIALSTRTLSMMRRTTFRSDVEKHFTALADRRAAAIRLAWRLYQAAHGEPARSIDGLVPEYLPTLPLDPTSADVTPFRMTAVDGRPAVYCYGDNGRDDHGSTAPVNRRLVTSRSNMKDRVYELSPRRGPDDHDAWDQPIFGGGFPAFRAAPTTARASPAQTKYDSTNVKVR